MNTKAKHAPGPWGVYPDGVNHYVVWDEDDNFHVGDESMRQATARLIAAAPELLAACDLALGLEYDDLAAADARVIINDNHKHRTVESMAVARANLEQAVHRKREKLAAIRAAIAKAKGEA